MIGELNELQVDALLKQQMLGRLGCSDGSRVYIVPITYAYDGEYIYGHSPMGMKIRMMRKNPRVCFEVDMVKNLANWQSVVVQGEYEELLGERARKAMHFFLERIHPAFPSETAMPSHGQLHFHEAEQSTITSIVFRIKILEKTGRFERNSTLASGA